MNESHMPMDEGAEGNVLLRLEDIYKTFDETPVIKGLSFSVRQGEFLTLLGPSGCGKTTTLRIIDGLELPDSGRVILGGEDVTMLPPNKRNVNTVFQNYALFPHMNVFKNVAYGLQLQRLDKGQIKQKVMNMLEIVQMEDYAQRRPDQLSGGQRQRIAIARALVNDPDVLLLDEPLGALDLQLRRQMQTELKKLNKQLRRTFIYITHDQDEALNMSDRIAIMNAGRFEQVGTPDQVYEHPESLFAAEFIGDTNVLDGVMEEYRSEGPSTLRIDGVAVLAMSPRPFAQGEAVQISLRSERVRYGCHSERDFCMRARIVEHSYVGGTRRTELALASGQKIECKGFRPSEFYDVGEEVCVYWNPSHVPVIASPV